MSLQAIAADLARQFAITWAGSSGPVTVFLKALS